MNNINLKYFLKNIYEFTTLENVSKFVIQDNIIEYAQMFVDIINLNKKVELFALILEKKKKKNKEDYENYRNKIKKIKESIPKKNSLLNDFFKINKENFLFLSNFIIFVGIIWFKKHFITPVHEVYLITFVTAYHYMIYDRNKIDDFIVPDVIHINKYTTKYSQDYILKIYSRIAFLINNYLKYMNVQNKHLNKHLLTIKKSWYNYKLKNVTKFSYIREKNPINILNRRIKIQMYNTKFKPNINDRKIALVHYNNFFENEQYIAKCRDDQWRIYAQRRISTIHTNWAMDCPLWFALLFIINKNCFPNIDNKKKLKEACLKYALYNDSMVEKNNEFAFHRLLTDYSLYFYQIEGKLYCIETDFNSIEKTKLFKQRLDLIYTTEDLLINFNFNDFFKNTKKNNDVQKKYEKLLKDEQIVKFNMKNNRNRYVPIELNENNYNRSILNDSYNLKKKRKKKKKIEERKKKNS